MARRHIIIDYETGVRPGELTSKELRDICRTLTTEFDSKVTAHEIPAQATGLFIAVDFSYEDGDLTPLEEESIRQAAEDLLGVAGVTVAVPEPPPRDRFSDLNDTNGMIVTGLTMPANTSTKQVYIMAGLADPMNPDDFTVIGYYANPNDGGGQRYIDIEPVNIPMHHTHFIVRTILAVQAGHATWPETFVIPKDATLTIVGYLGDKLFPWQGQLANDWALTMENPYTRTHSECTEWLYQKTRDTGDAPGLYDYSVTAYIAVARDAAGNMYATFNESAGLGVSAAGWMTFSE